MLPFQIYTFVGSWIWCLVLAYIGFILGDRWNSDPQFRRIYHALDLVIVVLLVAGIAWFVWSHWPKKSGREK